MHGAGVEAVRPYHHGHLRESLVEAAVELAREGGPDAVILREVSRRAGVSHNAAYRHFADRDDLMTAVASQGLTALARAMEARLSQVRGPHATRGRRGLRAVGEAYVRFALAEPGLFRATFALNKSPGSIPDFGTGDTGLDPYALLGQCLDQMSAAGEIRPGRRQDAELTCWSAVHGLSVLFIDGPLRAVPATEREAAIERVLLDVHAGVTS